MATRVSRGKIQFAAFDDPFPKTRQQMQNLTDTSYTSQVIANFVPNFIAMAMGVGRGKMRFTAFNFQSPKTTL